MTAGEVQLLRQFMVERFGELVERIDDLKNILVGPDGTDGIVTTLRDHLTEHRQADELRRANVFRRLARLDPKWWTFIGVVILAIAYLVDLFYNHVTILVGHL